MTKEVLVNIKGLHDVKDVGEDAVETVSPGTYYFRNGKHYVQYQERDEESGEWIKSLLSLRCKAMTEEPDGSGEKQSSSDGIPSGGCLEINRKGTVCTKLILEENRKNASWYNTPAGHILMGFDVKSFAAVISDERIAIQVKYLLEADHEPVSECLLQIQITGRGNA